MEASSASFSKNLLLNVKNLLCLGSFNPYIVNTNYQKVHKLTLLHEERLGKNQKSKSQRLQENSQGLRKFTTLARLQKFATLESFR